MKKIRKILIAVVAMFAITFVSASFVSCKNNEDDDKSVAYKTLADVKTVSLADVLAVYSGKTTQGLNDTVTFYSDGKYKEDLSGIYGVYNLNYTSNYGVYSGDPTTNGTVTITIQKFYTLSSAGTFEDYSTTLSLPKSSSCSISNSNLHVTNAADGSTITLKRTK